MAKENNRMGVYKILIFVGLLLTGVLFYLHFSSQSKVAYIDTIKLLDKYQSMTDAKKIVDQKNKVLQSNIDTLGFELENSIKKYEKDRTSMPANEIKLTEELLRNKQQQFIQYRDATTAKQKENENKITGEVISKLNEYIKRYGDKHNFQVILGGNASGTVLYAGTAIDITDEVIQGVNEEYKR